MAYDSLSGNEIDRLIQLLARLPGLGPRSARRVALHLIQKKEQLMEPLLGALGQALERISLCPVCGNIDSCQPCHICQDSRRDSKYLVVVEEIADLWALERARSLNGRYHVLGGTLSPLDGVGPEQLNIVSLVKRVHDEDISEVILAVNATIEGQTTAHYIIDQLAGLDIRLTRLAHGVPVGGELDYLDEGTLTAAMQQRQPF